MVYKTTLFFFSLSSDRLLLQCNSRMEIDKYTVRTYMRIPAYF